MIVKIVSRKENDVVMAEGNIVGYKTHSTNPNLDYVRINSPSIDEVNKKGCLLVILDDSPMVIYNSIVYIINKEGKTIDKIIV